MACSCCGFGDAAERQFGPAKVAKELKVYRRKGPGPTTRLLQDGLTAAGLTTGEVLDVGAGFGALSLALLDHGMTRAVLVEASSAYLAAASEEAARRGRTASATFVHGDFVEVADRLDPSTVVTMDRVVCCYADYPTLLDRSVQRARRGFAYSYPRDRWYVKAGVWIENLVRRARGNSFQTFVHPVARMEEQIERAGFVRVERRCQAGWCGDVYIRS